MRENDGAERTVAAGGRTEAEPGLGGNADDNSSSHKTAAACGLIESAGCRLLFLPPYSPDYNPIKNMWSKIKEYLRSLAARELPALYDAIATACSRVTHDDSRGFFKHCEYIKTNS